MKIRMFQNYGNSFTPKLQNRLAIHLRYAILVLKSGNIVSNHYL